jgi:hypothetical protein
VRDRGRPRRRARDSYHPDTARPRLRGVEPRRPSAGRADLRDHDARRRAGDPRRQQVRGTPGVGRPRGGVRVGAPLLGLRAAARVALTSAWAASLNAEPSTPPAAPCRQLPAAPSYSTGLGTTFGRRPDAGTCTPR